MKSPVNIFWFRRDLRLQDNAGLYYALKAGRPVVPVFIFDKIILDSLENEKDTRISFIYEVIKDMQAALKKNDSALHVYHNTPSKAFKEIIRDYTVENVYTNHDYEPYANDRDNEIKSMLSIHRIGFYTYKDQVIFDKDEILKDNGEPYTVFTPYSRRWKEKLDKFYMKSYPCKKYFKNFFKHTAPAMPTLKSMGFHKAAFDFPTVYLDKEIIRDYDKTRDYPALKHGTSRAGVHLRFGTISIRTLVAEANALNSTYLNELIWREFYQMILWHFPKVGRGHAFKPAFDNIKWRNNEEEFDRWCSGTTGYPIVDAGMRQLNTIGFMHNRVRMITGSFLAKHLLIDWRWGEAYFAAKLLDYDLAANNGGWQWAAGSGNDAAPYFRIFNPYLQTKRFDKDLVYIRQWVPELNEISYPEPMVEHEFARKRALEVYSQALRAKH